MKRYPFYVRLILLAAILPYMALVEFPKQPWHALILFIAAALFVWGMVLMYLRKTGKSNWDGPGWGRKFRASPAFQRFLVVVPAICAASIPLLFLFHHRLGLNGPQLSTACGVLLGISFSTLMIRFKGSRCEPLATVPTQQGGTK